MSCPDLGLHAHRASAGLPADVQYFPRRSAGAGIVIAWLASFAGHAGITVWLALASLSQSKEDLGSPIAVELVAADDSVPASASTAGEPASPSMRVPVLSQAEIAPPRSEPPAFDMAEFAISDVEQSIAISALAVIEPPRRPQPTEMPKMDVSSPAETESTTPFEAKDGVRAKSPEVAAVSPGAHSEAAVAAAGNNRRPTYPAYARRRGIEGRVVLLVEVTPEGTAGRVTVVESSRHDFFDEAAMEAVRTWRFRPARRDGTAVPTRLHIPVTFRLTDQ